MFMLASKIDYDEINIDTTLYLFIYFAMDEISKGVTAVLQIESYNSYNICYDEDQINI
jgi:hypothetical protein